MKQKFAINPRLTSGLVSALAIVLHPGSASAAGVSAGTLIQNAASATYTSGASGGTVQSNTVTVKVDELLDVAVTGLTATPVPVGSGTAVLTYSVSNLGNGGEAFRITVDPAVAGNPFDTVLQTIAIDSNGNNSYDPGVDQVLTNGAATPVIAADASLRLFVVVTLPTTATDTLTSQVRLTADAVTGTGTPGTAFGGQGDGGGDAVVGATGASAFASGSVVASLAAVSLVKSAAVLDPFGGNQPVPGATITYALAATVSGTGQAEGLHVVDAIPAGTTYQAGTLKLNGAALTDASDADAGTASASGVNVALGTVAGGDTRTVTFNVKID
jgi:uncharacterized repeat protein (TIGR01451 family)